VGAESAAMLEDVACDASEAEAVVMLMARGSRREFPLLSSWLSVRAVVVVWWRHQWLRGSCGTCCGWGTFWSDDLRRHNEGGGVTKGR
jgi:hypothetical protein